jgi:SAM-dependent methyltransferase
MDNEKMFDSFLGIETGEEMLDRLSVMEREPEDGDNPYQATFYNDLVTIFNQVAIEPEDTLVDFGCGLGRVLFYGNSRHYCKVAGIENNAKLYTQLLENAKSYQSRFLEQEERMFFHNVNADEYQVMPEDNFFYFFNPFSGEIFKRVLDNIVASVKAHPRDVNLIVYYPTYEIMRELRNAKLFVQKKMIKLSGYKDDPDEKAYIYYMSRYFVN